MHGCFILARRKLWSVWFVTLGDRPYCLVLSIDQYHDVRTLMAKMLTVEIKSTQEHLGSSSS